MKPISYFTSPIFPRFILEKRVDKSKPILQHADFSESHARSLGTNLPRVDQTDWSRKESEIIGKKIIPWTPLDQFRLAVPTTNDSYPISFFRPLISQKPTEAHFA